MSELRIVADLMAVAARTAPKSVGKDFVVIRVIEGDEVRTLAPDARISASRRARRTSIGTARTSPTSDVVVLIGLKDAQTTRPQLWRVRRRAL